MSNPIRPARRALLVLAAGSVVAAIAMLARRSPAPVVEGVSPAAISRADGAARETVDDVELERVRTPIAVERVAIPSTAPAARVDDPAATDTALEAPGKLRISALDAWSGEPIDRIRVRAMSETRFADRETGRDAFELELLLTPGTYALLVLVRGYEPAEVPHVRIDRGATLVLDPVRLTPGSARIVGTVRGEHAIDDSLQVELLGGGRRPCASCSGPLDPAYPAAEVRRLAWMRVDPCATCGYALERSRVPVARNGAFRFEGLAAMRATVRLVDARKRTIGVPLAVEVAVGETLPVVIDAVTFRTVRVELVDADGSSLADEWGGRIRRQNAAGGNSNLVVNESMNVMVLQWTCEFRSGDRRIAQATVSTPTVDGYGTSVGFGGRRTGTGPKRLRDDRPRAPDQSLRPMAVAPVVEPAKLSANVDGDGLARFDDVPACALELTLRCGSFRALVPVPASIDGDRLRARLELHEVATTHHGEAEISAAAATFRDLDARRYR